MSFGVSEAISLLGLGSSLFGGNSAAKLEKEARKTSNAAASMQLGLAQQYLPANMQTLQDIITNPGNNRGLRAERQAADADVQGMLPTLLKQGRSAMGVTAPGQSGYADNQMMSLLSELYGGLAKGRVNQVQQNEDRRMQALQMLLGLVQPMPNAAAGIAGQQQGIAAQQGAGFADAIGQIISTYMASQQKLPQVPK